MTQDVREQFWKALNHSPYLMVQLESRHEHAIPMAAQLDSDARGHFWFYSDRTNRLSAGGAAMAQFEAKGHDLFACISGTLVEETDPAVIDRYWSNEVEAWYEGGRSDPKLQMLRFELGDAEIWTAKPGAVGLFKMLTGNTIKKGEFGEHVETTLG